MAKRNKHIENRRTGSYFRNDPDKPRGFFTLADVWPKPAITPPTKPTAIKSESAPPPLKSAAISTPIPKSIFPSAPKKPLVLFKDVVTAVASGIPRPEPGAQHSGSSQRRLTYEQEMASALEKTQRQAERPIPVILGVDLGTSCTKVVWRDEVGGEAYPICFGSRPTILDDYLLPSVVAFDGSRFAGGGDIEDLIKAHPKAERFSNFKMCLACVSSPRSACNLQHCSLSYWRPVLSKHLSEEEAVEIVTTLHLGKVISLSKELVSRKLAMDGVRAPIQWIVNMAAPVEHMDDKDVLSAFERVLKTGYLMAEIFDEQRGARELEDLLDCYRSARQLAMKRVMDCFVIPEVGAEVISMCLSRASRDGLYAFVDVGAGTVDATFFRLHLSGDTPQISFYSDGVLKMGAAHLESIASQQLAEKALKWFRQVKEKHSMDGGTTLLQSDEAKGLLDRAGAWLSDEVETGIRHLSASAFKKEMNHGEWKKLILVLGGGGATHPVYDKASRQAVCLLAPSVHVQQLPVPKDMNMQGLPSSVFHRFAVAYGLSFNKVNLPDFNLPGQVEPDRPRQLGSMPECATPDVG